jgi:cyclophilin family peptidyl-prolyl cis-trans isomerase
LKVLIALSLAIVFVVIGCSGGEENSKQEENQVEQNRPRVIMETSMGRIVLELFPDVAPNHVKNFLDLANKGFYNGLTFHRVAKGFVIQGGSPDGSPAGRAGYTIPAEFSNLQHMPGTLAMARGADPNSASCQFYICLAQLADLDGKYTIFGQTLEGMDVIRKIGQVETEENSDKPIEPVTMVRVWEEGKEPPEISP